MENARKAIFGKVSALAIALSLTAALNTPSEVWAAAGGVQNCTAETTCTVGEFLFDDNSDPIPAADCVINSSYPDHSSYLSDQALSGGDTDGWYYHSFTAPATTGYYSATISCTVSGDTLSIDKSFEVVTAPATDPNAVATAVWGFSGDRTLSSFGTLPAEIWSYSTRTLSSFGTLVADIWNSATRTITGASLDSGSLATKADTDALSDQIDNIDGSGSTTNVTNNYTTNNTTDNSTTNNGATDTDLTNSINHIKSVTDETRLLLEKVVNKPIIENVLEQGVPDLSQKLDDTRAQANQLYANNQYLTNQTNELVANWNSATGKESLNAVLAISDILGESGDSSTSNTMFGQANWIKDSWSWDESDAVYNQLDKIASTLSTLKSGLANYNKTSSLLTTANQLSGQSGVLATLVGETSDSGSKTSLFAKISSTTELAASLNNESVQIDRVLADYNKTNDESVVYSSIDDLQNQVIALNKIPGLTSSLTGANLSDENWAVNALLGLRGIINSNKKMLALGSGQSMVNVWLEVGSIIFKTIATNPSSLVSQKVDIKYYLPSELTEEDVVKTNAGLDVKYDEDKGQLFVAGTFDLAAKQSRTFSVETKDIWSYPDSQIDSLKKQAEDLAQPLKKTAFYAQSVSLKTDINANLDEIVALQADVQTPEDKIHAYRQSVILMDSVDEKMTALKDLVTQASASSSLLGFVGGSQTIGVWGVIIVVLAGFVFLTIYMRLMITKGKKEKGLIGPKYKDMFKEEDSGRVGNLEIQSATKMQSKKGLGFGKIAVIILASSVASATSSGLLVRKLVSVKYEQKLPVLGAAASAPQANTNTSNPSDSQNNSVPKGGEDIVKIIVPFGQKVNIYKDSSGGSLLSTLTSSQSATRLAQEGDYVKVTINQGGDSLNGLSDVWVDSNFVKDKFTLSNDEYIVEQKLVVIDEQLNNADQFENVTPGAKYLLADKKSGWYQIVLENGDLTWIPTAYATELN